MKPKVFSENPTTIGEHIKRCRLTRGVTQKQLAAELGVNPFTVANWEKGKTEPRTIDYRAIILFLGYDPCPPPQTLPERMMSLRRTHGWSIAEAARHLGVDDGSWGDWERGKPVLWKRYRDLLEGFLSYALIHPRPAG